MDPTAVAGYIGFVLVGGLLVFGYAWALRPAVEKQGGAACLALRPAPRGYQAPELIGTDLDGQPVALADLAGKFVVLNFWATYCEPCTREWPELDRLAERFADRDDVVIVAVSLDDDRAKIAPYLERMQLQDTRVRIWFDPSGKSNAAFGSEKIPDTFFVDAAGTLVSAFIDVRDWGKPAAVHCVESMLEG
jgi:thiol-disulfide isomerase/thioredoxin